jgi:hypothetical protein
MKTMKTDPAIRRTRDARRSISASVDDDPERIVDYYIEMQGRFAGRLRVGPDDARDSGGRAEPAAGTDGGR